MRRRWRVQHDRGGVLAWRRGRTVERVVVEACVVSLLVLECRQLQLLRVIAHRSDDLRMRSALVWNFAGHELPENDAKAVDIGGFRVGLSAEDLRRHPVRSTDLAVVVSDELLLIPCQTKVTDLDRPIVRQQNILALEIAVKNLF